jgi:predicted PurR-regulated permease PerM
VAGNARSVDPDAERSTLDLRLPVSTILKVLVAAAIVWVLLKLGSAILLFLLATLLALFLAPAIAGLEKKGMSRGAAVMLVVGVFLAFAAALVWLVLPELLAQLSTLVDNYRTYQANAEQRLAGQPAFVRGILVQALALPSSPEVAASLKRPLAWGQIAVVGVTAAIVGFALVIYLLLDGRRAYAWLLAYVPRRHRHRMGETTLEVSRVITAYVQGQLLTSALFGLFAFAVLSLLHVPAAIPMALLAALCDVVPVLGIIIATVLPVAIALSVSPATALIVLGLYAAYHVLENYVIIPRVYGNRLRLSSLVVLTALIVGGELFGVAGAILALPIVAAYPIIERIWLGSYLSDEVLTDHSALEHADAGPKTVERVLRGQPTKPADRRAPKLGA